MGLHPYHPESLPVEGYVDPVFAFDFILYVFFSAGGLIFIASWILSGLSSQKLYLGERLTFCWFIITGAIHTSVEGPFVFNPKFYQNTSKSVLGFLVEIWKEYAKADSRYATRDPFIVSVEGFTSVIEGPLCFVIAYALFTRKSWRHVLALLVSTGQWYGTIMYFLTEYLEGFIHARPEPLYFWFYLVVMNVIWIIIPSIVMLNTSSALVKAVAATEGTSAKPRKNRTKMQ